MKGYSSARPLFDAKHAGEGPESRPGFDSGGPPNTPNKAVPSPARIPCNPTVGAADAPRLGRACRALLRLMADHEWHDNTELTAVGGMRFGARLEEMKDAGFPFRREKVTGGVWRYRLLDRGEPS